MYNILDFGAKSNTNSTIAIQQAIDKAFINGGGTVLVPSGTFIIGTLELKKQIHLYI